MADEVLKLAYDEARSALREQDTTLSNIRNRATGLLAAAVVGTSFSATAGLLNTDPGRGRTFPEWAAWLLLIVIILIAVGVMAVLWPIRAWTFGPSPSALATRVDDGVDAVLRAAIEGMASAIASNGRLLEQRVAVYRATVLVLMLEIGLLVVALILAGK
ncbi:hypothetical protein GCM10010531_11610 [Blastococcus jejuensis]|uniref:Holin-X, holin superfamily III n=1 Tax=Blastococcus jejuensis TaxID=351224 RepID=A0ABP6NY38_9ACTN